MAEREHKEKSKAKEAPQSEETEAVDVKNEELSEDVDALLDDIDDVLEENAEEFVQAYRQQGGE